MHGYGARHQLRWLIADATAPLAGAVMATIAPVPEQVFPVALGRFSGVFVYAATSSLIPRAMSAVPMLAPPLAMSRAALMFLVSRLA